MILSTKGRYAVMAMVDLAGQQGVVPVPLATIAERQEIPLAYLEQIFARLKRAGLVTSMRGPGGGYRLARAMEALTIADIMLASDEPLKMTRCDSHAHTGCMVSKARCLTHDLWEGLSTHIQGYLENVTLADVVKKESSVMNRESSREDSSPYRGETRRRAAASSVFAMESPVQTAGPALTLPPRGKESLDSRLTTHDSSDSFAPPIT